MKNGELIRLLQQFPEDLEVVDDSSMPIDGAKLTDIYLCDPARPDAETTKVVKLI